MWPGQAGCLLVSLLGSRSGWWGWGGSHGSRFWGPSRRLKNELLEIRRKGAKRGSQRYSERTCARCQQSLGRVSPKANTCRGCNHLVCRDCRSYSPNGSWRCKVCTKEA